MRSQPMFGLTTTTSPRETKRFIPPSASTARRVKSAATSVCVLGDDQLGQLECEPVPPFRRKSRTCRVAFGAVHVDPPVIPAQASERRPRPPKTRPAAPETLKDLASGGSISHVAPAGL